MIFVYYFSFIILLTFFFFFNSFLQCSGVYFRWLSLDQVFISSEGRLLLGGLTGAVNASNTVQTLKDRDREREKEKEREKKREREKGREKEESGDGGGDNYVAGGGQ